MKHLLVLLTTATFLHAQGPLTPPGAPAPTMKTLAQIEPRIDVLTLGTEPPYTINQPGSYYLSANMITASGGNAISIQAENVTLDLNGFTISSPPGGSPVNCISSFFPAVIKNGFIKGSGVATEGNYTQGGFSFGIYMQITGGTVTDLVVQGCSEGIYTNGTVSRCQVSGARAGITANTVTQSTVKNCSHGGIIPSTSCSESYGEGDQYGIFSPSAQIDQCVGRGTNGIGIYGNDVSRSNGIGAIAGISATNNVSESTGTSTRIFYRTGEKQYGIKCKNAISSTGITKGDAYSTGIDATDNVTNSTGTCTSAFDRDSIGIVGISCSNASNSQGIGTNRGIRAFGNASNCYGKAGSYLDGTGIHVDGTASYCRGDHRINNVAMQAGIAIGCTSAQGVIQSSSKHLGTP